jgi:hypothetical protein
MAVSDQGKSFGARATQRVSVNRAELDTRVVGTGEPVLLVHGSHIAGAFAPLMA